MAGGHCHDCRVKGAKRRLDAQVMKQCAYGRAVPLGRLDLLPRIANTESFGGTNAQQEPFYRPRPKTAGAMLHALGDREETSDAYFRALRKEPPRVKRSAAIVGSGPAAAAYIAQANALGLPNTNPSSSNSSDADSGSDTDSGSDAEAEEVAAVVAEAEVAAVDDEFEQASSALEALRDYGSDESDTEESVSSNTLLNQEYAAAQQETHAGTSASAPPTPTPVRPQAHAQPRRSSRLADKSMFDML